MTEYIITDKQLQTATEAYLEHELSLPITEVFISGDKLPEIVRCRDCECYDEDTELCNRLGKFPEWHACTEPDGFCKWAKRREP